MTVDNQMSSAGGSQGATTATTSRLLIPSPPKGKHGTANPTGQWSKAAHYTLKSASAEVVNSHHLRGQSDRHAKELFKAINDQQHIVNERLKKRLHETQSLRAKLLKERKQLQNEAKQLQAMVEKTAHLEAKLSSPMQKAKTRATIRNHRPSEENIADLATKAITQHARGVNAIQQQLHQNVSKAVSLVGTMENHALMMHEDIEQKTLAIEVDTQCLHYTDRSESETTPTDAQGPALPSASEGPYGVTKSSTNPEMWKQHSTFNVETARALTNEAKELRHKMLVDLKKGLESQTKMNSEVLDALGKRKTQTKQYVVLMDNQLRKIDNEIAVLLTEYDKVKEALKHKQRPLEVVKMRLETRAKRPSREAVRDDVEVALEKEFSNIVLAVQTLEAKCRSIEKELARLEKVRDTVVQDRDRKGAALALEQECLDLEERSEYAMDSRRGTPRGTSKKEEGESFLPPISARNGPGTPRTNTPR